MLNGVSDDFGMMADAVERRPFHHDAGQRFSAREADDNAAGLAELIFAGANGGLDRVQFLQRALLAETHVDQRLGQDVEFFGELIETGALPDHDVQQVKHCEHAVASSGMLMKDDVARLFAADGRADPDHFFQHIFVADGGTGKVDAVPFQRDGKAQVGHYGGDNGVSGEMAALFGVASADQQDMVAIYLAAGASGEHGAIRVPVEGDREIGVVGDNRVLDVFGMERSAMQINVLPVGRAVEFDDLGPKGAKQGGCERTGGPVAAIDDDSESGQIPRKVCAKKIDVGCAGAGMSLENAWLAGGIFGEREDFFL